MPSSDRNDVKGKKRRRDMTLGHVIALDPTCRQANAMARCTIRHFTARKIARGVVVLIPQFAAAVALVIEFIVKCKNAVRAARKLLAVMENPKISSGLRCKEGDRAARKFWEAKICART